MRTPFPHQLGTQRTTAPQPRSSTSPGRGRRHAHSVRTNLAGDAVTISIQVRAIADRVPLPAGTRHGHRLRGRHRVRGGRGVRGRRGVRGGRRRRFSRRRGIRGEHGVTVSRICGHDNTGGDNCDTQGRDHASTHIHGAHVSSFQQRCYEDTLFLRWDSSHLGPPGLHQFRNIHLPSIYV